MLELKEDLKEVVLKDQRLHSNEGPFLSIYIYTYICTVDIMQLTTLKSFTTELVD